MKKFLFIFFFATESNILAYNVTTPLRSINRFILEKTITILGIKSNNYSLPKFIYGKPKSYLSKQPIDLISTLKKPTVSDNDYNLVNNHKNQFNFFEKYKGTSIKGFSIPKHNINHLLNPKHRLFLLSPDNKIIVKKIVNEIKKIDQLGKIIDGANKFQTCLNKHTTEIRCFIHNDKIININAFIKSSLINDSHPANKTS